MAVQSDQATLSMPLQVELERRVSEGTLPFWSSTTFLGGQPLFANGSSAQLYPPHLLLAAAGVSATVAHEAFSFVHLVLAGFFTYLLLRELRVGWHGAVLAGVAWMFASFNAAWLHFEVVAPVQVMLPLGLLMGRRWWRTRTPGAAVALGVVLGITMMSGHVLWMAITCLIVGVDLVALVVADAWRSRRLEPRQLAGPVIAALVAAGTAAVVLVPTMANLASSQRTGFAYEELYQYRDELGGVSVASPAALVGLFVPPDEPLTIESINIGLVFAGTLTALCAVVAAVRGRGRAGRGLGVGLLGFFALAAIGGPVSWITYHLVPIGQVFRPYGRFFQWAIFGLVILGGIGLDEILKRLASRRRAGRVPVRRSIGLAVIALTALQGFGVARDLTSPLPERSTEAYPATGLIDAMGGWAEEAPWPARTLPISSSEGLTLIGNPGLVFDLDIASGYDSVLSERTFSALRFLEGADPDEGQASAFLAIFLDAFVPYDRLERFGVSALATPPGLTADTSWGGSTRRRVEIDTAYTGHDGNLLTLDGDAAGPRVVSEYEVVDDSRDALERFVERSFPWQERVVIERADTDEVGEFEGLTRRDLNDAPTALDNDVTVTSSGANRIEFSVSTDQAGLLVIPENYDAGWSATVDGDGAPVLVANSTQQVVPVPAGESTVALRYRPPGIMLGAAATTATLLVAIGFLPWWPWRRRHHHPRHLSTQTTPDPCA